MRPCYRRKRTKENSWTVEPQSFSTADIRLVKSLLGADHDLPLRMRYSIPHAYAAVPLLVVHTIDDEILSADLRRSHAVPMVASYLDDYLERVQEDDAEGVQHLKLGFKAVFLAPITPQLQPESQRRVWDVNIAHQKTSWDHFLRGLEQIENLRVEQAWWRQPTMPAGEVKSTVWRMRRQHLRLRPRRGANMARIIPLASAHIVSL